MAEKQMWTSTIEGIVKWSGGRQVLRKGQTISEDHPLFRERPDLFELADPTPQLAVRDTPGSDEPPVERGTRAPGERRPATSRTARS